MNPFDAPLRIQRREVDALRISISVESDRLTEIETARSLHDDFVRKERALAPEIPMPTDAWTRRMRTERLRMAEAKKIADARLSELRAQATEVYGRMRAIESAADRHREDAERVIATADQMMLDDLGAAAFLRARRRSQCSRR